MSKQHMGSHNGRTSPDGKMGKYQDTARGTDTERYQRRMGWWNPADSSTKGSQKDRAATKRRVHGKQVIREQLKDSD